MKAVYWAVLLPSLMVFFIGFHCICTRQSNTQIQNNFCGQFWDAHLRIALKGCKQEVCNSDLHQGIYSSSAAPCNHWTSPRLLFKRDTWSSNCLPLIFGIWNTLAQGDMFQTQNGNASCIVSKVLTRHYNHWLGPTHSFKGTPRTFLRLWPRKMPVNEFVEQTEQKFRLCPMSSSVTESSLHMSHRHKVM